MADDKENTSPLDFEADEPKKGKRKYIFDFHKARTCDHPRLVIVVRGSSLYRCLECNYGFWLPTATMWPLHWVPIMGAFMIGGFAKEFGRAALEQVFRTPIGQIDASPHKPVLPEGQSFVEFLDALDQIDAQALEDWPHPMGMLPVGEEDKEDIEKE